MKVLISLVALTVVFCTFSTSNTYADALIYDNSIRQYYPITYGPDYEMLDYATSQGGLVSKIVIGYVTATSSSTTIRVRFYQYSDYYDPGYEIKSFYLSGLPGTSGYFSTYEYIIPEENRFELPGGDFGYSFEVFNNTTYIEMARGATGNENYYWLYDIYWDWWYFQQEDFYGDPWSGFYMKLYTAPPIEETTCDITGYKFDDTDGDGTWDDGEPGLPDWEMYIDENGDGAYQIAEPNVATDPNGMYFFENLDAPATYTIREIAQDGWTQTLPGGPDEEYVIAAEPNTVYTGYDFGNTPWAGSIITLEAVSDTYADQGEPDTNFRSSNGFSAGMDGTMEHISFVKFDLSSIPSGQVIVSAKLQLDGSFVSIPAPVLGAYRCSSSWEEDTLTWNNMPSVDTVHNLIEEQTAVIDVTEWDVTDYADDEYVAFQDRVMTIAIKRTISSPSGARASFWSKDMGIPDLAPKLEIQYEQIFGGGSGERSDPYQINTGEHMNTIGLYNNRWGKHYKLMNDISLADYPGSLYNIIGTSRYTTNGFGPFTGSFDGNYHHISGFSYSSISGRDYIGLFGYVYQGALRNIIIESANLQNTGSSDDVGALAGKVEWGHVADCTALGGSITGDDSIGGLIGSSTISCIAGCSSSASVSGTNHVGGLIGMGGFSSIENSNATGPVSGTDAVGGFAGDSSDATIAKCYSTGLVTGSTNTGGFSGMNENQMLYGQENVFDCFWNETTSGQSESAAGTKSNTSVMQTQSTFTDIGWDFAGELSNGGSDDWAMPPGGGYPIHWYQLQTPPALPAFAAGDGTAGNPYQIETAAQLNSIGHNPRLMGAYFEVISDIDLDEMFYPIADAPYIFIGSFDGGQHSLSNIRIGYTGFHSQVGFMGSLEGPDAVLKNVLLSDPNVSGIWSMGVGSLLGRNTEALVDNCHVINTNVTGWNEIGGLVGQNYWHATVENCTAVGGTAKETNLLSFNMSPVGGLIGMNSWWSNVDTCSADVSVMGEEYLGGLVGYCVIFSNISNSCARGTVTTTDDYAGGLCYRVVGGDLTNCYSSAEVIGPPDATRLMSFVSSGSTGTYTSCLWDESVNGAMEGIYDPSRLTLINVGPESTKNMQMAATYQAIGWDFGTIWDMRCEGMNYPRLQCEPMLPGDFVCPEGVEINDFMILTDEWLAEVLDLSADIVPDGGDGFVNLQDWLVFAQAWLSIPGQLNWDETCDLYPEPGADIIDELDLGIFTEQWLSRSAHYADIAPEGAPDGRVDLLDYALFAENWMMGLD